MQINPNNLKDVSELKKYITRFGWLLFIILPILYWDGYGTATKTLIYKTCMVAIAIMACEMMWLIFFKPICGRYEDIPSEKLFSIMFFRSILYLAIILAFSLGL